MNKEIYPKPEPTGTICANRDVRGNMCTLPIYLDRNTGKRFCSKCGKV